MVPLNWRQLSGGKNLYENDREAIVFGFEDQQLRLKSGQMSESAETLLTGEADANSNFSTANVFIFSRCTESRVTSLLHDSSGVVSASAAAEPVMIYFLYERNSSRRCRSNVLSNGLGRNEKFSRAGNRDLGVTCFDVA